MKISNEVKNKGLAYLTGYAFVYILSLTQHGFHVTEVFPINIFSIMCGINIGIAIYCGLQRNGVWKHTPEVLKHVFASVGIAIILGAILQLVNQITGIDISAFVGV